MVQGSISSEVASDSQEVEVRGNMKLPVLSARPREKDVNKAYEQWEGNWIVKLFVVLEGPEQVRNAELSSLSLGALSADLYWTWHSKVSNRGKVIGLMVCGPAL